MRKNLQHITIILVICSLSAGFATAKVSPILAEKTPSLLLSYSNANTLGMSIQTKNVRYQLEIQKNQEGFYLLKAPPFLVADVSNLLHIGEIQPQGLFTRLLDPMSGNSASVGFIKNKNFVQNFVPSFNPKLSGLTLSMENVDIISFSPVLNPVSPTGLGAIWGNEKAYAAILTASQNNVLTKDNTTSLQVNWKELGYGKHMFFSLLGACSSTSLGPITIISGGFVQGAYDVQLGGGTTTAVEVKAKTQKVEISYENKLGGVGVKLRNLEEKANPQVKTTVKFEMGEKIKIFGEHKTTTYSKPIYGGNSQERTVEYTVGIKIEEIVITSLNTTIYEGDKGKSSNTELEAKAQLDKGTVKVATQIHRPLKGECEIRNTSLEFSNANSQLKIKNKKVELKLSWTVPLSDTKLELSIDQNKCVTAQLKF